MERSRKDDDDQPIVMENCAQAADDHRRSVIRDLLESLVGLVALAAALPVLLIAAVGIRLTSPGPIFYRPRRIGYRGREFTTYKLRTMSVGTAGAASPITAHNDSRVFPFGAWLRATKIDELPQLFNIVKGDMAIVGPRPEAPEIVNSHYTSDDLTTLLVPPGLTSPGTLYYYTHCERMLNGDRALELYVERVLPMKLALDRVYITRATVLYDLRIVMRTVGVIAARAVGRRDFPEPPEVATFGRKVC
jgi:lipopolysaccharide/colanic/teichoic acid biosynthesis glycosyltransferase